MDPNEIYHLIEQNFLTIIFGFLIPIVGYMWRYRVKKRDIKSTKKELVLLFGRKIAEEPDILNPGLVYNVIKSKEREHTIQRSLSRPNVVIQIFQDVQTEFIENSFIPKDQRKILLDKTEKIINDIRNFERIEFESFPAFKSIFSFFNIIVTLIIALVGIYVVGSSLSKVTDISFPFSVATFLGIFISTIIGSAVVYIFVSQKISSEEEEEKKIVGPIMEEVVHSALSSYFGEDNISREVLVKDNRFDFMINWKDKEMPVGVTLGYIILGSVRQFQASKSQVTDKTGLMITNSEATKNAKKFANKNDIIILENISNEEELINKLKYLFKEILA